MKRTLFFLLLVMVIAGLAGVYVGCSKSNNSTTGPQTLVAVYPVTATVLNPQGQAQGGATLSLQNPPQQAGTFSALTDSTGKATIQSPAGAQVLIARLGTVFQATINVNVAASQTPTNAGTLQLAQNTQLGKVLVVTATCEQLENVLVAIGFTTFDEAPIDSLRDNANADSVAFLTYLRQYALIFSDCDCNTEGGSDYAVLSRTYGRYVAGGGKMYGGHYNYFHLQRIWPPSYTHFDSQSNTSRDSLTILNATLASWVGFTVSAWDSSGDPRRLTGYEHFTDLSSGSKVYAVVTWTNPKVGVIVENYVGTGKFLWTDYHNQDIINVVHLRKIVQYFLLNM